MKEKYHIDEGCSIWQAKYIKIKYNYTKRINMEDGSNNLIVSSMISDFSDIKGKYKIEDKRFSDALEFCLLLSEKKNKAICYMEVYDEPNRNKATKLANKLVHTKWINEIINRMITSNHIMYCDKHYQALDELFNIGINGEDEKNRVSALKSFIDATKKPDIKADVPININIGSDMLDKLELHLKQLSDNAKILMRDGSIIDAEVIK
jgi:hypothetical protein